MTIKNRGFIKFFDLIVNLLDFIRIKSKISALYLFKRLIISIKTKVIYIIEDINWSINWDGKYITENLKNLNLINADTDRRYFSKNKIIHFGSFNCLKKGTSILRLDNSNKYVVTIFHIAPNEKIKEYVPYLNKRLDIVHTSSEITKKELINLGFDEKKIVVIPLGVDLSIFKNYSLSLKKQIRKRLNLPSDKIIIGSFQKDGVGWGEGLKPKLIKGPEIFCDVVKELQKKFDIHIFLTGPARGFIKKKLEEYCIPYTHIYLENYLDIVECYNALDLYIVTSRVEGGPKALLEGMATGVPLITTDVGMASKIIKHRFNGFITEIDDTEQLFRCSMEILNNSELKETIIKNGLKIVKSYSWEKISMQYYQKIYKKLIY